MASSMSPSESTITAGQIAKFQELLGAGLRKANLPSKPVQRALEMQGDLIVAEFIGSVRKRVDAISNMITRRVTVNRNRTPQEMLDATGRKRYTDNRIVETMPRGTGDEAEIIFFKVGRYLSNPELDQEYDQRGLKPADPFSLGAVNEADPAFADEHPNGTHWQDADGNWCYAYFDLWNGERGVCVRHGGDEWGVPWWFAGVRKSSPTS